MHINLRQVEIFIAVAQHGSFSRAAQRLHIAQSAVSIAVKSLEGDLGTRLFHRTSRAVALSPAGQTFLARVQPALSQLTQARQEMADLERGVAGVIAIATPAMLTQCVLAKPLVDFQLSYPAVRLQIYQAGSSEIARMVLAGAADIGITAAADLTAGLLPTALMQVPYVACVAENSPLAVQTEVSWQMLLTQPAVSFPFGYHQRRLVETQARKRGIVPRIVLETESFALMLEAVRRGIGFATVPLPVAQNQEGIRALTLDEDDILHVIACQRADFPLSRAGEHLLQHLRAALSNVVSDQKSVQKLKRASKTLRKK